MGTTQKRRKFNWKQTLFCLHSFDRQLDRKLEDYLLFPSLLCFWLLELRIHTRLYISILHFRRRSPLVVLWSQCLQSIFDLNNICNISITFYSLLFDLWFAHCFCFGVINLSWVWCPNLSCFITRKKFINCKMKENSYQMWNISKINKIQKLFYLKLKILKFKLKLEIYFRWSTYRLNLKGGKNYWSGHLA